jgi:hypothetical protein
MSSRRRKHAPKSHSKSAPKMASKVAPKPASKKAPKAAPTLVVEEAPIPEAPVSEAPRSSIAPAPVSRPAIHFDLALLSPPAEELRLPPPPLVPPDAEPIAYARTPVPVAVDLEPEVSERELRDSGLPPRTKVPWGKLTVVAGAALLALAVGRYVGKHPAPAAGTAAAPHPAVTLAKDALSELPRFAPRELVTSEWADVESAKHAAVAALEVRDDALALEAATRATELDPTDGEAWLILGAVHQDAGRTAQAFECYRTCTVKGRVDPKGECAAMLRSR